MAHETDCPACGAPLQYSGNQDVVTCGFCGAKLEVLEDENGQTSFRVLEKPEPQQDVLSNPVGSVDITTGEPVRTEDVAAGEPIAPGYISSFPDDATVEVASPTNIGASIFPGGPTASETPAQYQVVNEAQAARPAGPGRWIALGAAVFVAVCIMCACVVGAILAFSSEAHIVALLRLLKPTLVDGTYLPSDEAQSEAAEVITWLDSNHNESQDDEEDDE